MKILIIFLKLKTIKYSLYHEPLMKSETSFPSASL